MTRIHSTQNESVPTSFEGSQGRGAHPLGAGGSGRRSESRRKNGKHLGFPARPIGQHLGAQAVGIELRVPAVSGEVVASRQAVDEQDAFLLFQAQHEQVDVDNSGLGARHGDDRAGVVVQ